MAIVELDWLDEHWVRYGIVGLGIGRYEPKNVRRSVMSE
jgi:hypothetical protein